MPTLRPVIALALALGAPAVAGALEPRFDHRDQHGLSLEALYARDTVQRTGEPTATTWRPAARLAWGWDLLGEGDELLFGATVALRSFDDPAEEHVLLAADARYRAYFGTEEAKTFFDVGLYAPVRSMLAAGPLVGLGVQYDLSRRGGAYAAASFAAAFGEARVTTFTVSVGAQVRFDLP